MNLSLLSTILAILVAGGIAAAQDNKILTFDEAKKLADQGDAYGEAIVAFHYSVGWQTEKNPELAAKYALSSTRKGHPLGAFRLGSILCSGDGVPKNENQGLDFQRRAVQGLNNMSGNPYAITALGVMLFQGKVVPENKKEAARLYKIAAEMGFAPAQYNFAMCNDAGHGVAKDEVTANAFIWKALQDEYPPAVKHMGFQLGADGAHTKYLEDLTARSYPLAQTDKSAVKAVIQRPPDKDAEACAISHSGDRLAVIGSSIALWELPSGRLLTEFPTLREKILFTFFRGRDLVVAIEQESGAGALVFLNTQTGARSRNDILLPEGVKAEAYCSLTDALLCLAEKTTEKRYIRKDANGIEKIEGGEPKSITLFFIGPETYKQLPFPPFNDAWKAEALFDSFGNIMLLNIRFEPPYYGVSEYCIMGQNGDILDRASLGQGDFIDKAATALALPAELLAGDPANRFGGTIGDVNQDEGGEGTRLNFFRSFFEWNCPQPAAAVNLIKPARIWCRDLDGNARQVDIPGNTLTKYKYIAADNTKRGFLTWGVEGFGNSGYKNRPYIFCLDTLKKIPLHLPEESTLLNARKFNTDTWMCSLGQYEESPLLKVHRSVFNEEGSLLYSNLLGISDPYEITEITSFNYQQAVRDVRFVVENSSAPDTADVTFFGLLPPVLSTNGVPDFSYYSNQLKAHFGDLKWLDGKFSQRKSMLALWNRDSNMTNLHSEVKVFTLTNPPIIWKTMPITDEKIIGIYYHKNAEVVITTKNVYLLSDNASSLKSIWRYPESDTYKNVCYPSLETGDIDYSSGLIYIVGNTGGINILKITDDQKIDLFARIAHNTQGDSILFEPSGTYLSLAPNFEGIHFSDGLKTYPLEQFDLRLNRPDLVLEHIGAPAEAIAIVKQLREKRLKRMGVTEEMLQPDFHLPEIEIVGDLPSATEDNELALNIKASDSKYPLDRLRLYVNNVPVNGKEGELLRDAKSQTLERTIPIKLAAGRNKIQVSILNSAGAESLYANAEVQCTAPRPKPTLYAVAMGVSEYANPEWNLKYAAKDATDILIRIHSQSGSSYGEVKELLLTDREVTKENLAKIREFLSKATVDDTILMFVAGHGLLDSKYDYYFGTSDIDFDNPSAKGIAFEEFDDLLADLPCLKKSLLIDTCHAGELDEDEKKALAAAQSAPTAQQVAMHPVGARGMSVKPIEGARGKSEWYDRLQGLFVDLRRGSGSTILSSSAGAEYALESSEQKNGLFTYAVLEALDGKEGSDANKDGSVTMSELAEYVKSRVATLTNNKQSPNVRRVNLEGDFILAVSKSTIGSSQIISFDAALSKANAGDAYAQAVVSIYYGLGIGCEQNLAKSKDYAMLSAKQQNPLGIYRLAEMRESGEGMDKNTEQAAQLMQKAKAGLQNLASDPFALTALATIYERESPDSPKIREVLTKAADIGYEPAAAKLSKLEGSKY